MSHKKDDGLTQQYSLVSCRAYAETHKQSGTCYIHSFSAETFITAVFSRISNPSYIFLSIFMFPGGNEYG